MAAWLGRSHALISPLCRAQSVPCRSPGAFVHDFIKRYAVCPWCTKPLGAETEFLLKGLTSHLASVFHVFHASHAFHSTTWMSRLLECPCKATLPLLELGQRDASSSASGGSRAGHVFFSFVSLYHSPLSPLSPLSALSALSPLSLPL